ncbi:hypothetical protein M9Y10_005929 [Tritrichomonas musculus]|uniref:Uncharacterized protein n=1 Tax=Tritrichomonas musculus TaxID=1915356 RepID=A0ABR2JD46_9EUKA
MNVTCTNGTEPLRNYIIDSEKFKIVDGEPQDEDRVNVNMTDINNYYTDLGMCVNGVPASLDKMNTLTRIP